MSKVDIGNTDMYQVDENTPPPFNDWSSYYERSCDPFAPKIIAEALGGPIVTNRHSTGWLAIDWCENPVQFIPDGTTYNTEKPNYELIPGFYSDNRMFAYNVDGKHTVELKTRHQSYKL